MEKVELKRRRSSRTQNKQKEIKSMNERRERQIYRRLMREDQRGGGGGDREGRKGKNMQQNKANIVQSEKQLKNYIGVEGKTTQ